jgi:hypothetical protein
MDDRLDVMPFDGERDRVLVCDVRDDERNVCRNVIATSRREIVDDDDFAPLLAEARHHM